MSLSVTNPEPYRVGLADPPWPFDTRSLKGKGRSPERHYRTMPVAEIAALQLPPFAKDSAMFLWVTGPHLQSGLDVLKAWGFRYRGFGFVWEKLNPKSGTPFVGLGYYTRANVEICLLGVRGSMPVADRGVPELIRAPRRRHSQKPDEVYDRIKRLYPEGRRLELFARQAWPGWEVWGNEVTAPELAQVGGMLPPRRYDPERVAYVEGVRA